MRGLSGKVAMVTGAARGQGEGIARRLHAEGMRVAVTDVRAEAADVAADLGEGAAHVELDVADEDAWGRAVAAVGGRWGGLDVLVNNAGVLSSAGLEETSVDDYLRHVEVNQLGCFLGMRAAAPSLRARGGGSIVNIGSIAGRVGGRRMIAYTATKWAIRGMTRSAALELGADRIRVNAVLPGAVDTPMARGLRGEDHDLDAAYAHLPVARIGRPADTAAAVAYLASDDAAYVTGSEVVVDGGMLAGPPPRR